MHLDVFQHHVHNHGFQHQAQHAEQTGFHAESHTGRHRNQKVHAQETVADIDAGVALENHGHDIGAAAGSLHVKEDGASHRRKAHCENQLKQGLAGHGRIHGHNVFQPPRSAGQDQAGIGRAHPERAPEYGKAQCQQRHVDDEHERAGGQVRGIMGQYNGNAADPAGGKMIGEFEKVYAYGDQQCAHRQHDVILKRLYPGFVLHVSAPPSRFCGFTGVILCYHIDNCNPLFA